MADTLSAIKNVALPKKARKSVNELLKSQGSSVRVGMNVLTLLTSGIFGIPGVALLYGICFFKIL